MTKRQRRVPPEALDVYKRFPATVRSSAWAPIVALAKKGDAKGAAALAKAHEDKNPRARAENVVSRRLRVLRLKLFKAQDETDAKIEAIFSSAAELLAGKLERIASTPAGISRGADLAHESMVRVRLLLKVALRDAIWNAARMGLRSPGEAFGPIFADNSEGFRGEIAEQAILESVMTIAEDRLSFGIDSRIAATDPKAKITSPKWSAVLDRIYRQIVEKNNQGLTLSDRVFDLTSQTERALKQMIAREVSAGTSPADVARKAKRYLSGVAADPEAAAPGVYRNPTMNAARLARTETNRAYIRASTAWSAGKDWISGVSPTLSKIHDKEDECDDYAGQTMSEADFDALFPLHPFCMCYPTFVVDSQYLADYQTDDSGEPSLAVGGTE